MSDTTTITPEKRKMFREDASFVAAHEKKNLERVGAAEAILRLLTALEHAEASALTWTYEPPKVAGFYWNISSGMGIYSNITGIINVYVQNGELGYLSNGEFCTKFEEDDQWAGPIPMPIEP